MYICHRAFWVHSQEWDSWSNVVILFWVFWEPSILNSRVGTLVTFLPTGYRGHALFCLHLCQHSLLLVVLFIDILTLVKWKLFNLKIILSAFQRHPTWRARANCKFLHLSRGGEWREFKSHAVWITYTEGHHMAESHMVGTGASGKNKRPLWLLYQRKLLRSGQHPIRRTQKDG